MKTAGKAIFRLAFLCAVMLAIGAGCGKKGPPLPPLRNGNSIAAPSGLEYKAAADTLTLSWTHRVDEENARLQPDGFEVFLTKRTFEACEGCPFKFEMIATVPMPSMRFSMAVEKGFRYYFRIRATNEDGLKSEFSKTVQFENR